MGGLPQAAASPLPFPEEDAPVFWRHANMTLPTAHYPWGRWNRAITFQQEEDMAGPEDAGMWIRSGESRFEHPAGPMSSWLASLTSLVAHGPHTRCPGLSVVVRALW